MQTDLNTTMALMRTQLTICNERDVGDNQKLCAELDRVEPINGRSIGIRRFVAIVVHDTPEPGNQSAMYTYGIGGRRDGKLYVDNWRRVQIAIWNVIVNDIKFLVIGPHSLTENPKHRYLVEKMIDDKMRSLMFHGDSMSQLFKTYAHKPRTYAHEPLPDTVMPPEMQKRFDLLTQQSIDQEKAYKERRILQKREEETKREKLREEEKQNEEERRLRMKTIKWTLAECKRLEELKHRPMHPGPVPIPKYVRDFWAAEDKHGSGDVKWDELRHYEEDQTPMHPGPHGSREFKRDESRTNQYIHNGYEILQRHYADDHTRKGEKYFNGSDVLPPSSAENGQGSETGFSNILPYYYRDEEWDQLDESRTGPDFFNGFQVQR